MYPSTPARSPIDFRRLSIGRLKSKAISKRPASFTLCTREGTVVCRRYASAYDGPCAGVVKTYQNTKIEHNTQHILCLGQLDRFPDAQTLLIRSCLIPPVDAPAGYVTERAIEDGKVGLLELYGHTYLRWYGISGMSPVRNSRINLLLSGNWKR